MGKVVGHEFTRMFRLLGRIAKIRVNRWPNHILLGSGNRQMPQAHPQSTTVFGTQTAAPELFDIASETADVQKQYGMEHVATKVVGRGCPVARRMVQRGVRFVQLREGGWDAHGNIKANHQKMAARTDRRASEGSETARPA